eukprot:266701_1
MMRTVIAILVLVTIYAVSGATITGSDIDCSGEQECKGDTLQCTAGVAVCTIDCIGKQACEEAKIDGNGATSVIVNCEGEQACEEVEVNGNGAESLTLNCEGKQSCKSADLNCNTSPSGGCALNYDGSQAIEDIEYENASDWVVNSVTQAPTAPTTSSPSGSPTAPTTATPTTAGDDDDDDDDDSDSSDSTEEQSFFSALFSGANGDDVENANDDEPKSYTLELNLSEMSIINLWGLVAAFLLLNGALYLCFKR